MENQRDKFEFDTYNKEEKDKIDKSFEDWLDREMGIQPSDWFKNHENKTNERHQETQQ